MWGIDMTQYVVHPYGRYEIAPAGKNLFGAFVFPPCHNSRKMTSGLCPLGPNVDRSTATVKRRDAGNHKITDCGKSLEIRL